MPAPMKKCRLCERMGPEHLGSMVHLDQASYGIERGDHAAYFVCHRCLKKNNDSINGIFWVLGLIFSFLIWCLYYSWRHGAW